MNRFTAYLSDEERDALRQAARDRGASEAYALRLAVRLAYMPTEPIKPTDEAARV